MTDQDGQPSQTAEQFTTRQSQLFGAGFSFSGYERDFLALNCGGTYLDISGVSGADSVSDGRGTVFADLDNDGDSDIFLRALQGNAHHLFRNNIGSSNAWLRISLQGTTSGRDAYGTEVRLRSSAGISTKVKSGGSGFVSQSDPRLLFGLGSDTEAQDLEVRWPSGLVQRFTTGLQAGASLVLVEGDSELQRCDEQAFQLPEPLTPEQQLWQLLAIGPGEPLPKLTVNPIDGDSSTPTKLAVLLPPGRPALINLWATWCQSCRAEMPELQHIAAATKGRLTVLGISVDTPALRSRIPAFLDRLGVSYPSVTIDEQELRQLVTTADLPVPLTILLDSDGKAQELLLGWTSDSQQHLEALINQSGAAR